MKKLILCSLVALMVSAGWQPATAITSRKPVDAMKQEATQRSYEISESGVSLIIDDILELDIWDGPEDSGLCGASVTFGDEEVLHMPDWLEKLDAVDGEGPQGPDWLEMLGALGAQEALEALAGQGGEEPDSIEVSMTNELLGAGLAKVIVRKGVKKIKKSVKAAAAQRAVNKADRGTGSTRKLFPGKPLGTIRIVTYNVGVFNKGAASSIGLVADMIGEMKADAVAMQEVDSSTVRTGQVDQLRTVARAAGDWDWYFTPALDPYQGGAYGIGIISKSKLQPVDRWSLPLEKGRGSEQRALSVVEYKKFVLACTHLDQSSDAAQLAQARAVTQALVARYGMTGKVVILCGDFNAVPSSRTIKEMRKNWTLVSSQSNTYSSSSPKRCIDYIMILDNGSSYNLRHSFVARQFKAGDVREASDHLPSWIDIRPRR